MSNYFENGDERETNFQHFLKKEKIHIAKKLMIISGAMLNTVKSFSVNILRKGFEMKIQAHTLDFIDIGERCKGQRLNFVDGFGDRS